MEKIDVEEKVCCCCSQTCHAEEGKYPAVVFSGIDHDNPSESEQFVCEDCSIDFEEYDNGFVRRLDCAHCGDEINTKSVRRVPYKVSEGMTMEIHVCEECAKKLLACSAIRKGESEAKDIPFCDLKAGDTVFCQGIPIVIEEDAHYSGDATYDGYLAYGTDGESLFPEDVD